jgi:P4 family phage/plasmid primase-like protien
MIPKQLINQRFILTVDKKPIENNWTTISNYSHDDNILLQHLETTTTYGVLAGINNLIILDFDNEIVQEALLAKLPETFSVKTAGKGLLHLYFYTDDVKTRRYFEPNPNKDRKKGKAILDIQGIGTMVVGPNSKLSTSKKYEIFKDIDIATIYKQELLEILHNNMPISFECSEEEGKKAEKYVNKELDIFREPEVIRIKQTLKISTLLSQAGIPIHKNPTECPFHDSVSKACLSYNDTTGLWHCFHSGCNRGGDIFSLYKDLYNLNFRQIKEKLTKELFLKDRKYEDAMHELSGIINNRKFANINNNDIDNIAKLMIEKFIFITISETDKIYFYDEQIGVYKKDGEYIIQQQCELYFTGLSKTNVVNEITNKIKRLTHKPLDTFDKHKNLICVKNGVFNLETKLLIPHNPNYYFLNYLPIVYNENANPVLNLKFMSEIVAPENFELLKEMYGFLLFKNYNIQKAIIFVGSGGNGKSVQLHVIKSFLGAENISSETLHDIMDDRTSGAQLFGKLANIAADIKDANIFDSDMFKRLTSGMDTVSAQFKFQNKFTFVNYAKLLFSCNVVPRSKDNSNGYFRRWVLVKFPFTFEGTSDNKNLKNELTTEEELSGLFNLAVEKYFILKSQNKFSYTENVDEIREEYINMSDPLQVFINDFVEPEQFSTILKSEFYNKYIEFCTLKKIPPITINALTRLLETKKIFVKTINIKIDGVYKSKQAIVGFRWSDENISHDVVTL